MFPRNENRNEGAFGRWGNPRNENRNEGAFGRSPGTKTRNEGTFAKTTLYETALLSLSDFGCQEPIRWKSFKKPSP